MKYDDLKEQIETLFPDSKSEYSFDRSCIESLYFLVPSKSCNAIYNKVYIKIDGQKPLYMKIDPIGVQLPYDEAMKSLQECYAS